MKTITLQVNNDELGSLYYIFDDARYISEFDDYTLKHLYGWKKQIVAAHGDSGMWHVVFRDDDARVLISVIRLWYESELIVNSGLSTERQKISRKILEFVSLNTDKRRKHR